MTLLQIVQEFCRRRALPVPGAVVGSTDPQVLQILGLLNELCEDFITRVAWQYNVREATHTTVAAELQGAVTTIFGQDFKGIVPGTCFDRTSQLRLAVLDWEQIASRKGADSTGPWSEIYLRGGNLYSWPAPTAGAIWAFDYYSTYFVVGEDASRKPYWALDSDTWFSNDAIPLSWLAWRWKAEKGFDFSAEFDTYERLIASFSSSDRSSQTSAKLDGSNERRAQTGILVPIGNWPLP